MPRNKLIGDADQNSLTNAISSASPKPQIPSFQPAKLAQPKTFSKFTTDSAGNISTAKPGVNQLAKDAEAADRQRQNNNANVGKQIIDSKGRTWTKTEQGFVGANGERASGISTPNAQQRKAMGIEGQGYNAKFSKDPLAGGAGSNAGYKPEMISDKYGQRRDPSAPAFKPMTYQTKESDGTIKTRQSNIDEQGRNKFGKIVSSAQNARYRAGQV